MRFSQIPHSTDFFACSFWTVWSVLLVKWSFLNNKSSSKNFVSSILQKTYRSNFCTHHNYTVQNSASFHFNRSFWNNPFSWVSFLGRFLLLPNAWFLWLLSFSNAWFLWLLRLWNAWFLKLLLFPNVFFCLLATWLLWPLLLWLPFFDQLSVHLLRFPLFALLFHPSCFFQLFLHIVKTGNPLPLMARGLQLFFWSIFSLHQSLGKNQSRLTVYVWVNVIVD